MGPELMMRMQQQAEKFGTRVEYDRVSTVAKQDDGSILVKTTGGAEYLTHTVIIATGGKPALASPRSGKRTRRSRTYLLRDL